VRLARYSCSSGWQERFVTTAQDSFSWIDLPAPPDLQSQIRQWQIPEIEGFTAEVRPSASSWIHTLAQQIHQGIILTLDYGMPAADLYHPTRPNGTLATLRRHTKTTDPLALPGEQDLTSHVNFSELTTVGEQNGLTTLGLVDFANAWTRLAAPLFQDDQPFPNLGHATSSTSPIPLFLENLITSFFNPRICPQISLPLSLVLPRFKL